MSNENMKPPVQFSDQERENLRNHILNSRKEGLASCLYLSITQVSKVFSYH